MVALALWAADLLGVPPALSDGARLRSRLESLVASGLVDSRTAGRSVGVIHWRPRPPTGRELVETRFVTAPDGRDLTVVADDGTREHYRLPAAAAGDGVLRVEIENQRVEVRIGDLVLVGKPPYQPESRGLIPGWVVDDPKTTTWCDPTPAPRRPGEPLRESGAPRPGA